MIVTQECAQCVCIAASVDKNKIGGKRVKYLLLPRNCVDSGGCAFQEPESQKKLRISSIFDSSPFLGEGDIISVCKADSDRAHTACKNIYVQPLIVVKLETLTLTKTANADHMLH